MKTDLEIGLCVVGQPTLPPVKVRYSMTATGPHIEALTLGGGDILSALNERQREVLARYVRHEYEAKL